jgi:hypothetical protein
MPQTDGDIVKSNDDICATHGIGVGHGVETHGRTNHQSH